MAQNSQEQRPKRKRGPGRPFQKGQSGNPGGRPKNLREFREKCQEATEDALDALRKLLKDKSGMVRVAAATALLDRGWGKPTQAVEVSGAEGKPLSVVVLPPENAE